MNTPSKDGTSQYMATQAWAPHSWAPLLLSDPSPCLRYLVLRDLFHYSMEDSELCELAALRSTDPIVTNLIKLQEADGSWSKGVKGDTFEGGQIQTTGLALARLGFLGFSREHPSVQKGADFLFSQQQNDGSWLLQHAAPDGEHGGYSMMPNQTSFPLRGLAACGYATDPRCERAYEWLLAQRLPDGAWPTGMASGNYGYVAGYRRMAHSRWGCRSNTTGALVCFAHHPERCTSPEAQRALDLLLGRETRERLPLGLEAARLAGAEQMRGFTSFYARYDLAFVLFLCWRVGASLEDERVAEIVEFITQHRGSYGLWEYQSQPQASRWVTYDLLRTMSGLDENSQHASGWLSLEPRTPFQPYPKKYKRY
jgi:hypothetical protein